MIFVRKNNKIPEFYIIFARKLPELYIIIAEKIFFFGPDFFFLGGGTCAPAPCLLRLCVRNSTQHLQLIAF